MPDELYNLEEDPEELRNLADDPVQRKRRDSMRSKIMGSWNLKLTRSIAGRRSAELPVIQEWTRIARPPEPLDPWLDAPQQNYIEPH